MGRRYPGDQQPADCRLFLHANRLRSNVNLSALFYRLRTPRRRQYIPAVREEESKQLRVHDPPSGGLRSRCDHQHRAAEDIRSCPAGVLFSIMVVCGISSVLLA